MNYLLKNAMVFHNSAISKKDILICDGQIVSVGTGLSADCNIIDLNNCFIFPGFIDVHVHLREPGFSYKETIKTGSLAAAHGGYTDICSMPNLNPVPDSVEHILVQTDIINRDAVINVHPYGSITVNEEGNILSDMDGMNDFAVAFSDDGKGVQSDDMMLEAMKKAKSLNKSLPLIAKSMIFLMADIFMTVIMLRHMVTKVFALKANGDRLNVTLSFPLKAAVSITFVIFLQKKALSLLDKLRIMVSTLLVKQVRITLFLMTVCFKRTEDSR